MKLIDIESIVLNNYTPDELRALADQKDSIIQRSLETPPSPTPEDIKLLTRQEVADLFKVNVTTIYNWTKKGKLMPYGIGGRIYFKQSELEDALVPIT